MQKNLRICLCGLANAYIFVVFPTTKRNICLQYCTQKGQDVSVESLANIRKTFELMNHKEMQLLI